jgi:hypothetical protein
MPTPPTTAALSANIIAQLESSLSQTIPLLPKAFARVLAKVLAAVVILLYRYAGFSLLQQFIRYASFEETEVNGQKIRPLVEWGRQIGVGDPIDSIRAELVARVTVLNQVGSLAAGSQLVRQVTGVIYQVVSAEPLDDVTVDVTIIASSDPDGNGGGGTIGNLEVGDAVEFANPLPNVATVATIVSTSVIGIDAETEDEYRGRVLDYSQSQPQGGAYADYRIWGAGVPGVSNIYPYTGSPGEVDVYVECKIALDPDGIPDTVLLSDVNDAIQFDSAGLASRRQVGAAVNVLPITRTEVDVVVNGLAVPAGADEAAIEALIEAGVDEYLRGREPFIVGLSVLPRQDVVTQGAVAGAVVEIASAEGATIATVETSIGGLDFIVRVLGNGEKLKLGTITFP